MKRRGLMAFAAAAIALAAGAFAFREPLHRFFTGYGAADASALARYDLPALAPEARGAVQFALGDFGALDTDAMESHAVPWRLAGAALALDEARRTGAAADAATLRKVMERFGFLYPERIANWPAGAAPPGANPLAAPLGLTLGVIKRDLPPVEITVANLGCASCHAGPAFKADGQPDLTTAMLGAPNTALDLEAYVLALHRAFAAAPAEELIAAVPLVFPDTSARELATLKSFVAPRIADRLAKIEKAGGRPLPFVNGAPGVTNGVAALAMQLGALPPDAHRTARGFTAIPDLADRGLRSSLLYDGAYAPVGGRDLPLRREEVSPAHLAALGEITAFFTVPSMGVHPDRAGAYAPAARDAVAFLATYRPQRFPGRIDGRLAARGEKIYAAKCARCHGTYRETADGLELASLPNRLGPFDTDPERARVFDPALARAVEATAFGERFEARATGSYAGVILTGLWASAPYLHNGSVPTLRQLLEPAARATRFSIGSRRLDLRAVGLAGRPTAAGDWIASGFDPVVDTRATGFSNRGHGADVMQLAPGEVDPVLEYLKRL